MNVYFVLFVIYDFDDCFVVCNDVYWMLMFENLEDLVLGMYWMEVVWIVIWVGKIVNVVGWEEEWMFDVY